MIDMNKQESTLGLSVRDRAKQSLRSHRALIECAVYTVTGFVSANAFVLADLAPFGIAFAAAAKPQFYPAAVIGSILGLSLIHICNPWRIDYNPACQYGTAPEGNDLLERPAGLWLYRSFNRSDVDAGSKV